MAGTPLTGNAASFNPAATVASTGPAAGEAPAAAQLNVPLQVLLDFAEYMRLHAARQNKANTFANAQSFNGGITLHASSDASAQIVGDVAPTTKALLLAWKVDTTQYARIYIDTANKAFWITVNARWNAGTTEWVPEDAGSQSAALAVGGTSTFFNILRKQAGAGAFGSWDIMWSVDSVDATASDLALAVRFLSTVDGITAGTGLAATTGDIEAAAGSLKAAGDPASDQARVYMKQLCPTTAAKPTVTRATGVTADIVNNDSTDISGSVTLSSAAGVGPALLATIVFNKAYPKAPFPVIAPTDPTSAAAGLNIQNRTVNGFDVYGTIGALGSVGFTYVVM